MRKWALVLSGGGGRGISYTGVFKALEKLDLRPDMIAGTSIGAIMGGIYASGASAAELENFILNKFELKFYLESITYRLGDGAFFRFLQAQEALNALVGTRGIASGRRIHKTLTELTRGRTFEEAQPKFACNAVDLLTGREVAIDSGSLADGIRPSMSVPGIFAPVQREGMLLADGGILNNLPVWIPRSRGIAKVIAINCSPFGPIVPDDIPNGITVFFRALAAAGNDRPVSPRRDIPDLEIVLPASSSEFDFSRKREQIAIGEEKIMENAELIRKIISRGRIIFFPGFRKALRV